MTIFREVQDANDYIAKLEAKLAAAQARIEALEKAARRVLERCPVCDDGREDAECICTELVSARMVELDAALAGKG